MTAIIIRYFTIRAAHRCTKETHSRAREAATEIKAARRRIHTAHRRARELRLYAAWLNPNNPGWPEPPTEKPANVISITTAPRSADIQFPRISQTLGGLHFQRKGGAA